MRTTLVKSAPFSHFIGIDVGKEELAVYDLALGKACFVANQTGAIKALFRKLGYGPQTFVVCEATGGYERVLLDCTIKLGIASHRASATRMKSFIGSLEGSAKTDAHDAKAIAIYAQERHERLALWRDQDPAEQELQALVLRRDDLIAMRVAETNRLKGPNVSAKVMRSCKAMLTSLKKLIADIEQAIKAVMHDTEALRQKSDVLTGIQGIGVISATAILAHMPEIGTCTRRQAASLAGLAPHPKDSGKQRGYRATGGGRQQLRRALFMPVLAITRGDSVLSRYYQNLIKKGKKPLVAIVATMRKLITIANAKIRDDVIYKQS